MDQILVINKPEGPTSHDVVAKVRKIFKTKKVGHLGTLDPLAKGVLVVVLEDATKMVQFFENDSKEYRCTIRIGTKTDTYDITGHVLEQKEVTEKFSNEDIDKVLESFLGKQEQVPPIYSAIKVDGKKLYEYAREGKTVSIEPRQIEIFSIKRCSDIFYKDQNAFFTFDVAVSKGTFIRSLCVDIAERLGYPGTMEDLIRIRSGVFTLDQANTLEEIESGNYHAYHMMDLVSNMYKLTDDDSINKALNGMKISKHMVNTNSKDELVCVCTDEKLIAIYKYNEEYDCYCAVRVWN